MIIDHYKTFWITLVCVLFVGPERNSRLIAVWTSHQVYCSLWRWFSIIKAMSCIFRRQGGFRYLGYQWHICFGMSCPGEFPPTESTNNSKVGCHDYAWRLSTYEVIENSKNLYLVLLHQNYFKEVHVMLFWNQTRVGEMNQKWVSLYVVLARMYCCGNVISFSLEQEISCTLPVLFGK